MNGCPSSLPVRVLRLWLPVVLCLLGAVLLVVNGFDLFGVSAFAAFVGAGSSIWLANCAVAARGQRRR